MNFLRTIAVISCGVALGAPAAHAADLRILDASGLVRAVRVVSAPATVKITLEGVQASRGECVASNVDGLASEKREPVNAQGACVFKEIPAGTWQVTVPVKARWRVQINP